MVVSDEEVLVVVLGEDEEEESLRSLDLLQLESCSSEDDVSP